ncbi:MAG: HAMP domain-containing histidine kinase [Erysipelotrichaceae bacterium]|nr:HAMP domain-containing histidine kinase [Erysipelotrichaceae bacterium]MCI9523860.1 HAMP domain-containing histidine kinase [Erysipelotrichaceae bacterium]
MKRFSIFIKRLSLSQQLFALIFFFVTFFAAFFFVYLNGKVDQVIESKTFSDLVKTQNEIADKLRLNMDYYLFFDIENSSITNIITEGNKAFYLGEPNETIDASNELFAAMVEKAQASRYQPQTYTSSGSQKVYYSVVRINDNSTLMSFTRSEDLKAFKDSLVSSVINITVMVVGFFFIILMIWVAGLIHPLNQIRNYIEKVKVGLTPQDLKIYREDEIGELADALVSMRKELQKQEQTKEDMIHNISHDLKTPIATIKSYGESIKDGIYPYDTLEKSVDVIIENAERLEKKVHSLLYLNRVEYLISQDAEGAITNMKDVIEKVLLNIKVLRPDIEIITDMEDHVLFQGKEEPWQICVENILENALRYAKSQIVIHLHHQELAIENDGPSIEEERLKTLFKPYEKGQGGKFGLGLSIVHKVVQANHYQVYGENTCNGVVFRIVAKV